MKRLLLAFTVIILAIQSPVQAAWLTNVPQKLKQPNGTILNCYATGDEFHNWLHDANNFTILCDPTSGYYVYAAKSGTKLVPTSYVAGTVDPAAVGLQPGVNLEPEEVKRLSETRFRIPNLKGATGANTTGSINNIVIFIRFSDQTEFTASTATYNSAFNTPGDVSMNQYFTEVSGSQLSITTGFFPVAGGSTVVSYQDSHPRDYYRVYNVATNPLGYNGDTERNTREMALLKDATLSVKASIEATGLDYDNNNDNKVDNVCYIIQGAVEGWAELLWPHMWALYLENVSISGARVWDFNFQLSGSFGVSVLCHEMTHSLGYPDLYRYTDKTINPVGQWDIMASNTNPPQHQGVYTKMKYGHWLSNLPVISTPGTYTLAPLSTDPFAAYKIASPNSGTEFFVLEYRREAGIFENGLPGTGLIIYRVNTSASGNSSGPPDEIYVFRPDGTPTVNGNISGAFFSAGSGRTSFTAISNPSCFLSNGAPGGIEITNIGSAGETISFEYKLPSATPILNVLPPSRSVTFTASTTSFDVTNTGGGSMVWTANVTTGATWAHITSGASGTNTGTINVSLDPNPNSSIRSGVITISSAGSTGSPKTVTIEQAANPPILNVLPPSRSVTFTAGTTSFDVSNTGGGSMAWTAAVTTGATWAHITSGASGTNTGTINVSLDPNPNSSIRSGVITISSDGASGSPKTVTIEQAANPPILNVLPPSRSVTFTAGTTTFDVTNTGGGSMAWTAAVTTGPTWVHITSGASGTNTGIINVSLDPNPNSSIRSGVITISSDGATGSPKTVTIEQAANPPILNVLPPSRSVPYTAGSTTFDVTNTGGGTMTWTASVTTGPTWAHITSGASGTNTGVINVSLDPNPNATIRSGVITVTSDGSTGSPKTVTIDQAANPPILNVLPPSRSVPYTAGSTTFDVTNTGGGTMTWTAAVTIGASWAHITSGESGTNTGLINVSIDANPTASIRSAVITVTSDGATIPPQTFTIEQAANPPVLNVLPPSRSVTFTAGTTSFDVSNSGGGSMAWTASVTTGPTWAHITSGASGINTGTINVSLDPNPDASIRSAVITISSDGSNGSPKTVTIEQAANPPILNVLPPSRSVSSTAGNTTFDVTNTGGGSMVWIAEVTTGAAWAHITSGATGINTGVINVALDANPDATIRSAVITIRSDGTSGSPKTITIDQAGVIMSLSAGPDTQMIPLSGGTTSFAVMNTGGGSMAWTASVTDGSSFVHITSGASGTNTGTIMVSVDPNPTASIRSGAITVRSDGTPGSPKTVSVIQAANPQVLNVLPPSRSVTSSASTTAFDVTNTGGGSMVWIAEVTTGASWAHITSGAAGINTGTINVSLDPNPDASIRSAVITVRSDGSTGSPKTITIEQAANPPILNVLPPSRSVTSHAGTTTFDVTNTGGGSMVWTAEVTGGSSYVHIISGATGINTGVITVSIDPNPDPSIRSAVITIRSDGNSGSPATLTIDQSPNTSSITLYNMENTFTVYPNPASSGVTLMIGDFKGSPCTLEVLNMTGQLQIRQLITAESTAIDLKHLTKGIYFFRVTANDRTPGVIKVVKD